MVEEFGGEGNLTCFGTVGTDYQHLGHIGLGVVVGCIATPDGAVGFVKLKLQCIGGALGMRKQPWGVL